MKLHDLETPNKKTRKRVGRGQGSGLGQQSGRGHKGAKSRNSYKRKFGFEGGQMPLARRVPKSGFINPFKVTYVGINLSAIQKGIDAGKLNSDVTIEGLINAGLLHKGELVKILGQGDLKGAVRFKVNAWSASAEEKIRAAGGSIETVQ